MRAHQSPGWWPLAFFTLILLWPATLAARHVAGTAAGAAAGALCLGLLTIQLVVPLRDARVEPTAVGRPFESPEQAARHTLRLPTQTDHWQRLWSTTSAPEAYLYFMLATRSDTPTQALVVRVAGQEAGVLSASSIVTSFGTSDAYTLGWHRLRVSRAQLEAQAPVEVTVLPRAVDQFVPGAIRLMGGYSFRPTAPPTPSAFFDGQTWSTDAGALFPEYGPSHLGPARYYVELRLVEPRSRRVLAIYY